MPKPFVLTSDHIEQIFSLSKNLQRIEFYGGEPLLDDMSLTLLEKLIDSGQSKNISLFYNTNGTVKPSVRQYTIWNQFKNIEFNFSLDDINERFTYNRHPANWNKVIVNIAEIRSYTWSIVAKFYSICTISNLNIFYLPELLETMDNLGLPYFLNNIFGPAYYDITFLPMPIKQKVIEKLRTFKNVDKIQFLINMLNQPENLEHWEQFKFWTYEKDLYRKENFAETYPEFYKICQDYDPTFLPKNLTTAQDSV
jgi:sulfatase maturation enzyme AslB (radical SAM superfamily)